MGGVAGAEGMGWASGGVRGGAGRVGGGGAAGGVGGGGEVAMCRKGKRVAKEKGQRVALGRVGS
jgi:hypothetical protein